MYSYAADSKNLSDLVDANIKIPLQLLNLSSKSIKRLISPSTYYIYNKSLKSKEPINLFASLKYAFSNIAEQLANNKKFQYDEVIVFDTFGEGDIRKKLLNEIKNSFINKKIIKMSPGKQILDISHIEPISDGFLNLIFEKKNTKKIKRTFFASTYNRLTLKQLIKRCEKIKKVKLNILWGALKYRKNEIMNPIKPEKNNICKKDNLNFRLSQFLRDNR